MKDMITLDNKRIHDYIFDKDTLVDEGRKISGKIDTLDIKIKEYEEKEKKITGKVKPSKELIEKGDTIVKQIQQLEKDLQPIIKKINDDKLSAIPKDMKEKHTKAMKDKEELERERNKIALKVQKIKDKLIPLIQKEVKPLLATKYDDISTAKTKNGKVVITTFNHLEEFTSKFK